MQSTGSVFPNFPTDVARPPPKPVTNLDLIHDDNGDEDANILRFHQNEPSNNFLQPHGWTPIVFPLDFAGTGPNYNYGSRAPAPAQPQLLPPYNTFYANNDISTSLGLVPTASAESTVLANDTIKNSRSSPVLDVPGVARNIASEGKPRINTKKARSRFPVLGRLDATVQKYNGRHRVQSQDQGRVSRCSKRRRSKATAQRSSRNHDSRFSQILKDHHNGARSQGFFDLSPTALYAYLLTSTEQGHLVYEPTGDGQRLSHSFQGMLKDERYAVDVVVTAKHLRTTRHSIVAERYRWYQPPSNRSKKSNTSRYRCTSGCRWSTERKADWEAHEKAHYPPTVWLCPREDCTLRGGKLPVFVRQDILKKHLRTCHEDIDDLPSVETCRIEISDSRFPTQCIIQECREEFVDLQDRLHHIEREHFSISDERPWRTIRHNTAAASESMPRDMDTDSESSKSQRSDSEGDSVSSESSSEDGDNDDEPADGGGSNNFSSQSFQDRPARNPDSLNEHHSGTDFNDNGSSAFGQFFDFSAFSRGARARQRYLKNNLILLPILLRCPWNRIHEILSQAQLYKMRARHMSDLYVLDIGMIKRGLALIRKILNQQSHNLAAKVQNDSSIEARPRVSEQVGPVQSTLVHKSMEFHEQERMFDLNDRSIVSKAREDIEDTGYMQNFGCVNPGKDDAQVENLSDRFSNSTNISENLSSTI